MSGHLGDGRVGRRRVSTTMGTQRVWLLSILQVVCVAIAVSFGVLGNIVGLLLSIGSTLSCWVGHVAAMNILYPPCW